MLISSHQLAFGLWFEIFLATEKEFFLCRSIHRVNVTLETCLASCHRRVGLRHTELALPPRCPECLKLRCFGFHPSLHQFWCASLMESTWYFNDFLHFVEWLSLSPASWTLQTHQPLKTGRTLLGSHVLLCIPVALTLNSTKTPALSLKAENWQYLVLTAPQLS